MRTELFTFVNRFSPTSAISQAVDSVREQSLKICPGAKKPKLYNHKTIFPPFRAPPDEMKMVTAGLLVLGAQYRGVKNHRTRVTALGVDFFRNPGNDAMVLRLDLSPQYKEGVHYARKMMHTFSNWEFPLLGYVYSPHICFVEGEGIYQKLFQHRGRFEAQLKGLAFHTSFPEVMIKRGEKPNTFWEVFDLSKNY